GMRWVEYDPPYALGLFAARRCLALRGGQERFEPRLELLKHFLYRRFELRELGRQLGPRSRVRGLVDAAAKLVDLAAIGRSPVLRPHQQLAQNTRGTFAL